MTYLNTVEAGEQLAVHAVTVRRLIQREELAGFRVGRQFRTTQAAVDAYKAKSPAMAHTDAPATDLADGAGVIERLAKVIAEAPAWLFDRTVPAPAGLEPLHGALAGTSA
ncbi:excisionase family DNA-binding protein [Mycolicibacterium senegalense]|uniref:excisionase family DNA-binding protein n=1 Tax=Mycolicibacterium senegalense TaxID=1796 RepID=UPI003AAA3BE4